MNYYPHHISAFNSATRHLTRIERSVYRDMLDLYYVTEMPLTLDIGELCRRIQASSSDELAAVKQVLGEFFTEKYLGWHHVQCDEVIAKWKSRGWFPSDGPQLRPSIDEWKITRLRIFERDAFTCRYCGAVGGLLECDHVTPVSRGGSNGDDNLTTACRSCNRKKSNKLLPDFLREAGL